MRPAAPHLHQAGQPPGSFPVATKLEDVRWQLLMPVRPNGTGKSRLLGATTDAGLHSNLVLAIQRDAMAALVAARAQAPARRESHSMELGSMDAGAMDEGAMESGATIAGIHVLTSGNPRRLPPGVELMPDAGGGLNAALAAASATLRSRYPRDRILALVGDLPSLRAGEVLEVLQTATAVGRSFVSDINGTGTTMLMSGADQELAPCFGPGSAARHRASGAISLMAGPGARSDVDTVEDLQRCLDLGVGPNTARMVGHLQPFT